MKVCVLACAVVVALASTTTQAQTLGDSMVAGLESDALNSNPPEDPAPVTRNPSTSGNTPTSASNEPKESTDNDNDNDNDNASPASESPSDASDADETPDNAESPDTGSTPSPTVSSDAAHAVLAGGVTALAVAVVLMA